MRRIALVLALFVPVFAVQAQSAAPRMTLASYVPTEAEAAVIAARQVVQGQLGEQAEQARLKALAHLGLGKPAAARREAERFVRLVPGYKPQPGDPAAFAALVLEAQTRLGDAAPKQAVAAKLD